MKMIGTSDSSRTEEKAALVSVKKTPLCPLSVVYGVECTPSEEEEEKKEGKFATRLKEKFLLNL